MSADDEVRVDAIVVGGGPAGLAAAYTMTKLGLEVLVLERGEYAGSKNVGGLLYGTVLNQMIPAFYEKAPIERSVARRMLTFLGDGQSSSLSFGADEWSAPPFNNTFIVYRSQFDRWFAREVEGTGASVLEGTVVEKVLYEGTGPEKRAIGVEVRGEERFFANVIVLADGANALVSDSVMAELGMTSGRSHQEWALGVKEIIGLPREKIEDRFNLSENEGTAIDFIGSPFDGLIGGGFLYTGKESVHLGFAARLETLNHVKTQPHDIMNRFKEHPVIRKYLQGGELLEYSAHLIPEGGYDAIPQLTANGVIVTGDAAGLVNMSLYKEGTNHAMESGRAAGEAISEAKKKNDFSRRGLASYEEKLSRGVALKDLKKSRKIPEVLSEAPELLSLYPRKATQLLVDFFTVASESKSEIQKRATRKFFQNVSKVRLAKHAWRARSLL